MAMAITMGSRILGALALVAWAVCGRAESSGTVVFKGTLNPKLALNPKP